MGVIITGTNDNIKATDGSLSIEGFSIKTTGIGTFDGGVEVGTAATIKSNGNATFSGIVTASSYIGDGSALTGIAGTEITNSDFAVGVSTFFADYSTGRAGIGTIVPAGLLHVKAGPSGSTYSANAADTLILERNAACVVDIRSTATTEGGFVFSDQNARAVGRILYNHTNDSINFTTDSAERLNIRGDGRVSIASSLAVAGVCTAAAFVPSEGQLSHRNLIINGATLVAQRGTSSTSSSYQTVDRMNWGLSGHSVTVTQSQHALVSGDSGPWEEGFRTSAHIELSGAGTMAANTTMSMFYKVEAQDMANSGWDYTSTSSYITISFWLKVSTAQTFYLLLFTTDGTAKSIVKAVTPTNTNWNKFTFNIPGAAGIQFDNNADVGLSIGLVVTYGTDKTGSGDNLDAWGNYNSSERVADMASTWLTAGASTYEFTGLQLEVGSYATPFEHRSYGDELQRCQRYYWKCGGDNGDSLGIPGAAWADTYFTYPIMHPVPMRTTPTYTGYNDCRFQAQNDSAAYGADTMAIINSTVDGKTICIAKSGSSGATAGQAGMIQSQEDGMYISFSAEL